MDKEMTSKYLDEFQSALAFLTALPLGSRKPLPNASNWFSVAGMLMGISEGIVYKTTKRLFQRNTAAILTVLYDVALTSGIHLDGLADSADGLFSHVPLKSRLDIMESPDVGTYGVLAIFLSLSLKVAVLSEGDTDPISFMVAMAASRKFASYVIKNYPYAKQQGLVTEFIDNNLQPVVKERKNKKNISDFLKNYLSSSPASGAELLLLLVAFLRNKNIRSNFRHLIFPFLGGIAGAFLIVLQGKKKINGYSGDVLGAAVVIYETLYYLIDSLSRN